MTVVTPDASVGIRFHEKSKQNAGKERTGDSRQAESTRQQAGDQRDEKEHRSQQTAGSRQSKPEAWADGEEGDKENRGFNAVPKRSISPMLPVPSAPVQDVSLLACVLEGDQAALLRLVKQTPAAEVVMSLPIITCLVDTMPFYCKGQQQAIILALHARADVDADVAQCLECLYLSGFASSASSGITASGKPSFMSGAIVTLFQSLADNLSVTTTTPVLRQL
jgi:hypothetical protein